MDRHAPKRGALDLAERARRLIKNNQGILTRDLLRTPGGFGLGQVPERLAPDFAVNLGMACPKGWEALTPLRAPDRATQPMLRDGSGRSQ